MDDPYTRLRNDKLVVEVDCQLTKNIFQRDHNHALHHDLATLYKDYEQSQRIGTQAVSEAYRNSLMAEKKTIDHERDKFFFSVEPV